MASNGRKAGRFKLPIRGCAKKLRGRARKSPPELPA